MRSSGHTPMALIYERHIHIAPSRSALHSRTAGKLPILEHLLCEALLVDVVQQWSLEPEGAECMCRSSIAAMDCVHVSAYAVSCSQITSSAFCLATATTECKLKPSFRWHLLPCPLEPSHCFLGRLMLSITQFAWGLAYPNCPFSGLISG